MKGNWRWVRGSSTSATPSIRRISLIVTDMAVIEPTDQGLVLREGAPGVTVEQIVAATSAKLVTTARIPRWSWAWRPNGRARN